MPAPNTVADLLNGQVDLGSSVTVRGWLRSKRDSKAGISFLAVHDGSSFEPIQAVAAEHPGELRQRRCCRCPPAAPWS